MGGIQIDPDWPNKSFNIEGTCFADVGDVHWCWDRAVERETIVNGAGST